MEDINKVGNVPKEPGFYLVGKCGYDGKWFNLVEVYGLYPFLKVKDIARVFKAQYANDFIYNFEEQTLNWSEKINSFNPLTK